MTQAIKELNLPMSKSSPSETPSESGSESYSKIVSTRPRNHLNTHTRLRSTKRLEIHYTPKHGSWLNMAEIKISAMVGQCLNPRRTDRTTIRREVDAWQEWRNRTAVQVDWRFTTADARIKLKSLYPSVRK